MQNTPKITADECEITAVRSSGSGGQNVNKVSTAIHLKFSIKNSRLPERLKTRLLNLQDARITKDGIIIIKAQSQRTQEFNKRDALERLNKLISSVSYEPKVRKKTKPSNASIKKRIDQKKRDGLTKILRKKIDY